VLANASLPEANLVSKIIYFWQQSWLLIVSSFCFGLLIAVTNAGLAPKIEQNKVDKLNSLTRTLLPAAKHFQPVDAQIEVALEGGKKEKAVIYKAVSETDQCVGWSFNAVGTGFADKIELVVAVDAGFQTIAGFSVLSSNETPGFGDQMKTPYFRNQFAGAPAGELKLSKTGDATKIDAEIVAITGATVTSQAVVDVLNSFVTQIKSQMQQKGLLGNGK